MTARTLTGAVVVGCDLHALEPCSLSVRIRDDLMELWITASSDWDADRDRDRGLRDDAIRRLVRRALTHSAYLVDEIEILDGGDRVAVEARPRPKGALR